MRQVGRLAGAAALALAAGPARAEAIDGAALSPIWAIPFLGVLMTIALGPLLARRWWHPHYGKFVAVWAALVVVPMVGMFGAGPALRAILDIMAHEYIPFIVMLFALFTAAGGLSVRGGATGTPLSNVTVLAIGAVLSNVIGTMGAAMILIRPLLRANAARERKAHVAVFFIFLVANIGGALTPLGDPPLFLGFLRGVDFFWTTRALLAPTAAIVGALLLIFHVLDRRLWSRESVLPGIGDEPFAIEGKINIALILVAVGAIAASGMVDWRAQVSILGLSFEAPNIARDVVLLLVGLASAAFTPRRVREECGFEWAPIIEVAILFAAIFACLVPVAAMLQAGTKGSFAAIMNLATHADGSPNNHVYFWLSGLLSAFLDSAPSYLVFFEAAGGDATRLMGPQAPTLMAISLGTVYLGALSYIGNAPNFVVYAIARDSGVAMPGFVGYMAWSFSILLPAFALVTLVFIR